LWDVLNEFTVPPSRPPYRRTGERWDLLDIGIKPYSTNRATHGLASMQLNPVMLAIDLLNQGWVARQHHDDLVAGRMAFPACPGHLGGADHYRAPSSPSA
jgi:hypothetical protein